MEKILDKKIDNFIAQQKEMIDYIWDNRKSIIKKYDCFDYPDYCGLPKRISKNLSSDFVDYMQSDVLVSVWNRDEEELELWAKNKKQLVEKIIFR